MNLKMSLDKKSVFQIAVLVLLVLGAGAVYLVQQEDGLGFITELLGDKQEPPKAPVAKAPETKAAAPAPRKPKTDAAAIPAEPAKGQLAGKPFAVESAVFESGALILQQGKEGAGGEVRISLPGARWEVPSGRQFKFVNAAGDGNAVIRVEWPEGLQVKRQIVTQGYTLRLEFDKEAGGKLPGKVHLALPEAPQTTVAGTFEAAVRGFRFVDGKPDLTVDAVDTLQYLALRALLKDDPDRALEIEALRDARITPVGGADKRMTGYLEVEYRVGQGAPITQRFQFLKEAEAWKVARTLDVTQIDEAHPLAVPGPKEAPARLFPYLAAKRLEADVQKKSPRQGVHASEFRVRQSDKHKVGVCEAVYRVGADGASQKTVYLFRLRANGWTLERALGAKERVNFDTGKIEKR